MAEHFVPEMGTFSKASELDLGKLWRTEKVRDFEWRMRCLGIDKDPEARELLYQMLESTQELNTVGERLQNGEIEPKWWWDGEYDRSKADEANDEGTARFKQKEYGKAFDSFTTAIRLYPSIAVYHCNRAGAGLRLKQYDAVVEDCVEALKIEPSNKKALMRIATALQKLGKPHEAKRYWQKLIEIEPDNMKAKNGYEAACTEVEQAKDKLNEEEHAANRGLRTKLPRREIDCDWGDALYSSSEMLAHHQDSLSARLAYIEALIMCRRYKDVFIELENVPHSIERLYLLAEAQWRSSKVAEALSTLSSVSIHIEKCCDLQNFLSGINLKIKAAELAFEDGRYHDVIEALSKVCQEIDPSACSGLYAEILQKRSQAYLSRGLAAKALEDMDSALKWESENKECLFLRSKIKKQLKDYQGALSDLSILQSLHYPNPDVFRMMQELATISLNCKDPGYKRKTVVQKMGFDPYHILDISDAADELEIRRAYRKKAAKWHPDKWMQKSKDLQKSADLKFKEIQKAYDSLLIET